MDPDERYADLHLHSTCSDGANTPAEVVARASSLQLSAIALTDHDTIAGIPEAEQAAREHNITFITGVEISTGRKGQEVHVLGYGIDPKHAELLDTFARLQRERDERVERIVTKLRDAGVEIDLEKVKQRSGGAIGRMHVAQELVDIGRASTVQNAFDRFLKHGRPGFVPKPLIAVEDAIALIHRAGGLAFHAHPGLARQGKRLTDTLDAPFDGIEAFHSKHTPAQTQRYLALANERGLLVSGGSDCHGAAKGQRTEMGRTKLPWPYLERLQKRLARRAEERNGS